MSGKKPKRCVACGYVGPMQEYSMGCGPALFALVLLAFFVIPGLIYIVWISGKTKCPKCSAVGKSASVTREEAEEAAVPTRKCPSCAETIKVAAVKCRHCGDPVPPAA